MHPTLTNLSCQHIVKLLMLLAVPVLLVDVLQARLLILLNALLNVLLLLLKLQLFAVVTDDIAHAIHDSLDAATPLSHLVLPGNFFIAHHAHVLFDLVCIGLLLRLKLGNSPLLLANVVLNYLHCSLALYKLFLRLSRLLFLKLRI